MANMTNKIKFSLLHATRGRPGQAMQTRQAWLHSASDPSQVEHIFAAQQSDKDSYELPNCYLSKDPPDWASSSVSNWNLAAEQSKGEILIVIADDLLPFENWDRFIADIEQQYFKPNQPWILKIEDNENDNGILRHPVMSRAVYNQNGYIFHPEFYGVFCDNHLTKIAADEDIYHKISGDAFRFQHLHKVNQCCEFDDEVTAIQNSQEAYGYGQTVFDALSKPVGARYYDYHKLSTVWVGPQLGVMEMLTIKSLLAQGHRIDLYVDMIHENVPEGVTQKLLSEHLPEVPSPTGFAGIPHQGLKNGGIGSLAHWSDLVAWTVLAKEGGVWIQMDVVRNKRITAPLYCFTPFAGGIQPICMTMPKGSKCAWEIASRLREPTANGWKGQDWHKSMAVQTQCLVDYQLPTSIFTNYYDCGGRVYSPYNMGIQGHEPTMIHWSNATNYSDKNKPKKGSYYEELCRRYGVQVDEGGLIYEPAN